MKPGGPKGVIIWDFDGVLFETSRQTQENLRLLGQIGIPEKTVLAAREFVLRSKKHFSMASFIRALNRNGKKYSARKIRHIFLTNWRINSYYDLRVDALLHRLKKRGFVQMVLSMGNASFQYKKMFEGCGTSFGKHFTILIVTRREKYHTLRKFKNKYNGIPFIFIDDTRHNLDLAQMHVPNIKTIQYSNVTGHTLGWLEKQILHYAKK